MNHNVSLHHMKAFRKGMHNYIDNLDSVDLLSIHDPFLKKIAHRRQEPKAELFIELPDGKNSFMAGDIVSGNIFLDIKIMTFGLDFLSLSLIGYEEVNFNLNWGHKSKIINENYVIARWTTEEDPE